MNNGKGRKGEVGRRDRGYIKRKKISIQHTKALINNSNLIINMKIHEQHKIYYMK